MKTINLLDLDNDILNIIGDYVKKDNLEEKLNEKLKQDILELMIGVPTLYRSPPMGPDHF